LLLLEPPGLFFPHPSLQCTTECRIEALRLVCLLRNLFAISENILSMSSRTRCFPLMQLQSISEQGPLGVAMLQIYLVHALPPRLPLLSQTRTASLSKNLNGVALLSLCIPFLPCSSVWLVLSRGYESNVSPSLRHNYSCCYINGALSRH